MAKTMTYYTEFPTGVVKCRLVRNENLRFSTGTALKNSVNA